jgi:hypothetical protein
VHVSKCWKKKISLTLNPFLDEFDVLDEYFLKAPSSKIMEYSTSPRVYKRKETVVVFSVDVAFISTLLFDIFYISMPKQQMDVSKS